MSVGDLNDDGEQDFAATLTYLGVDFERTQVQIIFMSLDGSADSAVALETGQASHHSLACLPDGQPLGEDPSVPRLFVGVHSANSNVGKLWVWRLSRTGTSVHETTWGPPSSVAANSGAWFVSMGALGDVSGDGIYDLAVIAGLSSVYVLALNADDAVQSYTKLRLSEHGSPPGLWLYSIAAHHLPSVQNAHQHDVYIGTFVDTVLVVSLDLVSTEPLITSNTSTSNVTEGFVAITRNVTIIGEGRGGFPSSLLPQRGPPGQP